MNKLNYLLIMPCFIENTADELIFPLGIAYISASMKTKGFNTYTLNLNHYSNRIEETLKEKIVNNKIDVVLTGGLSFQYSILKNLVDMVKSINPKIKIIVGGGIITGDPIVAMKAFENVDFGVIGEGEITTCELCKQLENDKEFDRVLGIIYKDSNNQFVLNESRDDIKDLDSLPFPDYEGFEYEKHLHITKEENETGNNTRRNFNSMYIIGSRSCPYNCTFCFHTSGKKYRQRSLDNIFQELDYLVGKYGIKYIGIQDELFSHNKERIKEFCQRIKKYNLGWWAQFRVDTIDDEIVETVINSGCNHIGLGLESADNTILKSMNKGITIEKIEKALDVIYKHNITFIGVFIFGDKEETWETAHNTLTWWSKHMKYRIDLRLINIFPGSYLYKYAINQGIITDAVKYLKDGCPQINVSKMTNEEFQLLNKELIELPLKQSVEFSEYTYQDDILEAKCTNCGRKNVYNDVVFFSTSHLACTYCGQKHNTTTFPEVLSIVERNLKSILIRYNKIAIWSINYHVGNLFEQIAILQNNNVFPIDIAKTKQDMMLGMRKVNHPDIIKKESIEIVIVGVGTYKRQIEAQIRNDYKVVKRVIDICELTKQEFKIYQ